MGKERGYIKSWRPTEEDDLYFKEPFTKWQAWHDLLFLALYRDTDFEYRDILIHGKRGEVWYSHRWLAERWQWSKRKVDRFIEWLIERQRIVTKTNPQTKRTTGCISIVNYEKYQSDEPTDEPTQAGNRGTQTNPQTDTKVNPQKTFVNDCVSKHKTGKSYESEPTDEPTDCHENEPNIKNNKEYKEFVAVSCARTRGKNSDFEEEASKEEKQVLGFQNEILKSQLTVEQTCMTLHITPTQYQGLIQDFTAEQLAKGTDYLGYSDYRRHAYDWIRAHIAANEIDQDGHTAGNTNKAKITKGQSNGNNSKDNSNGHGYDGLSPKDRAIREANRRDRIAMGLDPDPEPTTYGSDFEF